MCSNNMYVFFPQEIDHVQNEIKCLRSLSTLCNLNVTQLLPQFL